MVLITDKGVLTGEKVNPYEINNFAFDTEDFKFYRVEIFDETENHRIAVGNPIWNKKWM